MLVGLTMCTVQLFDTPDMVGSFSCNCPADVTLMPRHICPSECDDEGEAMMVLADYLQSITTPKCRYGKRKSSVSEDKPSETAEVRRPGVGRSVQILRVL